MQSYFTPKFPKIIFESIFIDIHLFSHTNFTISSIICRLVNLLKNAVPPYNSTNRVVTLDRPDLSGKYYWLYFGIAPLANFYVTVKRQEYSSLVMYGAFFLNYDKEYLYRFVGKKVKFGDGFSPYLYLMVYPSTQTSHYILQKDMRNCHGGQNILRLHESFVKVLVIIVIIYPTLILTLYNILIYYSILF